MVKRVLMSLKLWFLPCSRNNFKPYFLDRNLLLYFVLFLFVLKVVVLPFYFFFPKNVFFAQVTASALFELTNKERENSGLPPLQENPQLERAAFLKAQDMLKEDYFAHQSPEGASGWDWIKEAGYDYKKAGENLAIGFLDSEEVHLAWENSPPHRRNILNPDFKEMGIAVAKGDFGDKETTLAVQFFGSPQMGTELGPSQSYEKEERGSDLGPSPGFEKKEKSSPQFEFSEFVVKEYDRKMEDIVFYSLIVVTLVLFLEALIFISLSFKERLAFESFLSLAPKTAATFVLLIILFFFDKQIAFLLVPHNFRIYGC